MREHPLTCIQAGVHCNPLVLCSRAVTHARDNSIPGVNLCTSYWISWCFHWPISQVYQSPTELVFSHLLCQSHPSTSCHMQVSLYHQPDYWWRCWTWAPLRLMFSAHYSLKTRHTAFNCYPLPLVVQPIFSPSNGPLAQPTFPSFQVRMPWERVTKALLKSRYITTTTNYSLVHRVTSWHCRVQPGWWSTICPLDYSRLSLCPLCPWKRISWQRAPWSFHWLKRGWLTIASWAPFLAFVKDGCHAGIF